MYSFEEEVEENVNKINAVKLKATAEICIVERHPFSENFLLKRIGVLFLNSLELCLAHCRKRFAFYYDKINHCRVEM
ncbi:hypothetical protein T03_2345 [Trichinella britovi]|uniref:Apple domain-containing protein n=1 Tax=Trichinella britovi TaxID=45882 RepID=A0A0V0Z2M1_TRIBR|nr:hypothetical protein T03_2345 [Trichinella britovi]